MNKKYIVAVAALLIAVSYVGLASAHQEADEIQNIDFKSNYKEMLDLHKQYFNNEIEFEEFYEEMESSEFHNEMPCHKGFGMKGMMW